MRRAWLAAIGLSLLVTPTLARADDVDLTRDASGAPPDPFAAFPLTKPHDKHYVRAALEIGGILTVGLVDYLLNTSARGGSLRPGDLKWDLRYDPARFRGKFTGDSYSWDSNLFGTNFASHPFAGTMYYTAARSNHLSFVESYAYAIGASAIWEYFGEIREINSINDMIVTPVSGVAIGETTMQLSSFFDRGERRFSNRFLSFLLSPWKFINEGTDDEQTIRTTQPDALGFPTEPWHRFTFDVGGGVTIQDATEPAFGRAVYTDWRAALDLEIANLPDYARAGEWSRVFDDGNRAGLVLEGTLSGGQVVDGRFATRLVPAGYYYRHAAFDRSGHLAGEGLLVGLLMGFEYALHDYDRDRARVADRDCIVSPIGIAAEYVFERGGLRLRTGLDLSLGLAGISPYALTDFEKDRGRIGLPTVTRDRGYDYSLAVGVEPTVDLTFHSIRWDSRFRLDTFRGSLTMDESPETVDPTLTLVDRRASLRTTLSWEPGVPRFGVSLLRASRSGEIGSVRASRAETSIMASTGVVF